MRLSAHICGLTAALAFLPVAARAGPPFITDDPAPTDLHHYEIYFFTGGGASRDGIGGASGIDFNYGALPDLQLTAVLPVAYERPVGGKALSGIGNIELAAKYRFLHQEKSGWDVAFFPRVFLPSASAKVGDDHAALLLPIWVGKDWGEWSTFGGGGCVLQHGGDARDFCLTGWAVARQVRPHVQIGAEIVHQTADAKGGSASTGIGAGVKYDLSEHYHLLAYAGPGLQNLSAADHYTWYASLLVTY